MNSCPSLCDATINTDHPHSYFRFKDCDFINPANPDDIRGVSEIFSNDAEARDLSSFGRLASISCTRIDGLVNGFFPQ
jgi:hypothetical protein